VSNPDDHKPIPYPITDEWRELVRHRMGEMGIGPVDLAKLAKTTHGTISQILSTSRSSEVVPRIHAALGWPPPSLPEDSVDQDEEFGEVRGSWRGLDAGARKLIADMARKLSR